MGYFTTTFVLLLGLLSHLESAVVNAQKCTEDLLVDDFSNYVENLNALGFWTSDDKTMASLSAEDGKITFTAQEDSYFYSTLDCFDAASQGYTGVKFSIVGPEAGSFVLELQSSSAGCNGSEYESSYVELNVEGEATVSVPFSAFEDGSPNAVRALVWGAFTSEGEWELSSIELVCGGEVVPPKTTTTSTSTRPAPPTSTSTRTAPPTTTTTTTTIIITTPTTSTRTVPATSTSTRASTSTSTRVVRTSTTTLRPTTTTRVRPTTSQSPDEVPEFPRLVRSENSHISKRAPPYVIDDFMSSDVNALGFWHGGDEGLQMRYSGGRLTITPTNVDFSWYTTLSDSCTDFSRFNNHFLHIEWSGSNEFTVALQQHNSQCNRDIAPFPETWDVVEARRYAVDSNHIYIPMSHFNINKARTIAFALKAFTSVTKTPTVLSKIELVDILPDGVSVPEKQIAAPLYFQCTRPNSFAFAIDDGQPRFAQEVMQIIKEEGIKVTFFTVGQPLYDASNNFTNVYKEMLSLGHQVGLHSFTHPQMEGLPTTAAIDDEITRNVDALRSQLGITSKYFRPPYGTEGARLRTRLQALIPGVKVIQWSVDIEDWIWGENSPTPEKQLDAFSRDVAKGGNLVVLHYLYPSTVSYLREFIRRAKATGKDIMRVDQCMEDPDAPPL